MKKKLSKNIKKEITNTAELKNLIQLNQEGWHHRQNNFWSNTHTSNFEENENPRLFSDLTFVKHYRNRLIHENSHHAASMWYPSFFLQK